MVYSVPKGCLPQIHEFIVGIKGRRDYRMTLFLPFSRTDVRGMNDDDDNDDDVQTLVDVLKH